MSEPLNILYEDNHLIAVVKPAGVLVQGDDSGDASLMDYVKEYLKEKYKKEGNVFLGLVHRLDRNVSGIVVYAKTSKGASRVSEQFRQHEVSKIYTALVVGKLEGKQKLVHHIQKDDQKRMAFVSDSPMPGYDYAELEYEVLESNEQYSLLKINLKTGRFHQIRAQLAHVGYPIVGDKKYGGPENNFLGLCATELHFKKATEDEVVDLSISYPFEWESLIAE
jgi:23S rRNA pseudouridine1911/1915/1917 synthase